MEMKKKILNQELAALVAGLKHGDMLYISDAGSAINEHAIYPLADNVQYINLAAVNGVPTVQDIVETLVEVSEFESAVLPYGMDDPEEGEPEFYHMIEHAIGGKEYIHEINYAPEYYDLRNRCTAMIQTGDYGFGHNVILIAGWPSNPIDLDILMGKAMYVCTAEEYITMPMKEFKEKYRSEE